MCGILGMYLDQPRPEITVPLFSVLGYEMDGRGGHAYGMFIDGEVRKDVGVWHENVAPWGLRDARVIMGHTRSASVGAKTKENAHPFTCGNIIGLHNGGIRNYADLNKKYDRHHEVDSPHIFDHLNEGKDLKELEGWGAVTYVHADDPRMRPFMAKISSDGALEVAMLHGGDGAVIGVAWASTYKALKTALKVSGVKHEMLASLRPQRLHWVDPDETSKEGERSWFWVDGETPFGVSTPTYVQPKATKNSYLGGVDDWGYYDLSHYRDYKGYKGETKPKKRRKHVTTTVSAQEELLKRPGYEAIVETVKGEKQTAAQTFVSGMCVACGKIGFVHLDPAMDEPICTPCDNLIDEAVLECDGEVTFTKSVIGVVLVTERYKNFGSTTQSLQGFLAQKANLIADRKETRLALLGV